MDIKEKAFKYAQKRYGNKGNESQNEIAKVIACRVGYEAGWNEAIKSLWTLTKEWLPKYEEEVIVLDSDENIYFCHRSNNKNVIKDNDDWCRYKEFPIIAWMPIPSFDEILKANKDVLK